MSDCSASHRPKKHWVVLLVLVGSLLGASLPARAVVNGQEAPCDDRRYDAVGLFLTGSFYPCGGFISGSCVLIGPNVVLLARHELDVTTFQPLPDPVVRNLRVRFRRAVDGSAVNTYMLNGNPCHGIYQEFQVVRLVDAPSMGTDMVLAYLDRNVENIRPLGIELNAMPRAGTRIVIAGWGYDGQCFGAGQPFTLRVARGALPYNVIDSSVTYTVCGPLSTQPCLQCPAGGPWVSANLHDSGGALLIEQASSDPNDPYPEIRLLGTITTLTGARRGVTWNQAGGQPQLQQATPWGGRERADFNCDGRVGPDDLFDFLTAFFSGRCIADLNHSGVASADDIFTYLQRYFSGM